MSLKVAGAAGFEPATYGFETVALPAELYPYRRCGYDAMHGNSSTKRPKFDYAIASNNRCQSVDDRPVRHSCATSRVVLKRPGPAPAIQRCKAQDKT